MSRQTACKLIARAAAGECLSDRRSRPLAPREAGASRRRGARVVEARRARLLSPLALAAETGVPALPSFLERYN